MRFVVVGAGAVGGVVGGLLDVAGFNVTLVARGEHLTKIQQAGLRLRTIDGEQLLPIRAVGSVAEVDWCATGDPADPAGETVVLLAVKSDATAGLLAELAAVAPPTIALACLQNGVANEPLALRWFERVYGICVMAPTSHTEPGLVAADCGPVAAVLDIGRYPATEDVDPAAATIAAALERAGMLSQPRADVMPAKYRKLLSNLGNAVDAACARGEAATELMRLARAEGEAVLTAAGIAVTSADDDTDRRGDLLRAYGPPGSRGGGSTWQSLARGTGAVETDYLNGEIVAVARRSRQTAPVNELLQRTVAALATERGRPRSLDAAALLTKLDRG
ncbi:ketopantoate reductase family protein [Nakamurella lactea]|uniref:ketopantoate reductase family protein n=1 Tax=Nakamurella lactea TaxID=459515 RepID=UPI000404DB84|nr:2-dehydropantoate 2-reductase N-terminal domain-containing protein [Nakamurella lactea]